MVKKKENNTNANLFLFVAGISFIALVGAVLFNHDSIKENNKTKKHQ